MWFQYLVYVPLGIHSTTVECADLYFIEHYACPHEYATTTIWAIFHNVCGMKQGSISLQIIVRRESLFKLNLDSSVNSTFFHSFKVQCWRRLHCKWDRMCTRVMETHTAGRQAYRPTALSLRYTVCIETWTLEGRLLADILSSRRAVMVKYRSWCGVVTCCWSCTGILRTHVSYNRRLSLETTLCGTSKARETAVRVWPASRCQSILPFKTGYIWRLCGIWCCPVNTLQRNYPLFTMREQ